jgi:hypothetical protein
LVVLPGVALLAAVLHVARLDVLLLIAMPLVVAMVLPRASTFFVRAVIAAGFCYCANFVVAWLVGLVGVPFVPLVVALAVLLPITFALCLGWLKARFGTLMDGGDAVALFAGLVVLMVLWLPTARDSTATILSRLAGNGEDNSAHLGIVRAITLQHGLLFGEAQHWSGRLLPGHTAYPPGFHVNVALVVSALENLFRTANSGQLVRAYFYGALALQALWAMTTVLAVRALASVRRAAPAALAVVAVAVVLFFVFGPPDNLLQFGFQSQIGALWMLTLEIFVAATPELDDHPLLRLSLLLLAMVGTDWSWYLVSPPAVVAALAFTWLHRGALLERWRLSLAAWMVAGVLSLPPIIAGLMISAPSYINSQGAVFFLDRVFLAILILAALASVGLPEQIRGNWGRPVNLAGLLAAGLLAVAVRWYQVRTAGATGYYYEKLLYTIIILAALGAGAVALVGLSAGIAALKPSRWRQASMVLACAGLTWLSTGVVTPANPGRHYLTGTWIYPDVGAMHHLLVTAPPGDPRQVLFWGDEPQHDDYFASRFAAGIYLRNSDLRNDFVAVSYVHQDDRQLLQLLRQSRDGLWLITRNPRLRERLMGAGFSPADLDRLIIDTITEPKGGAAVIERARSYDISPRGLFPSLFRVR